VTPYGGAVLRAAEPGDLGGVTSLERIAFADPWSRRAFADLIGNPAVLFVVADSSDATGPAELLGYVVAWFAADESEIGNLAVAPRARGRGVGGALLDAALAEAVRRGAAMTYLEVRESNVAARRLYASRGFAELGRRRKYYHHPTEDALVLGRPTAPPTAPPTAGVETAHPA